jgi:hypothetical protein
MVANGKHRKSQIFQLLEGDRTIRGHETLKSYITDYYKNLFGPSDGGSFSLDEDRRFDITIKGNLLDLFNDFYEDKLPLFSINFRIITLEYSCGCYIERQFLPKII